MTAAVAAPGWAELATPSGRELLNTISAAAAAGQSTDRIASTLRAAGTESGLLAAALTQQDLRQRATAKFGPVAAELLFTRAGLEQATRHRVADLHAARFARAGCTTVADLGCGIGAESMALLRAGVSVLAVERDPLTAAFAEYNLAVTAAALTTPTSPSHHAAVDHAPSVIARLRLGDAEEFDETQVDGVFLDPARRTAGHSDTRRIASPDDYSPSLAFAFGCAERLPTGVKLGPGLDRDLIPDDAEAQWVSVDGQLVETGLWFGALARQNIGRSALVIRGAERAELTAREDAPDADVVGIGDVLYEPDGAVIRARLIGALATQLSAGMLTEGIAYLSASEFTPTPFAQGFRVIEQLPARERDLKRALAERNIGTLEIKKRGADVDPAQLRKRLKLSGADSATLFLTRSGNKHIALLTERLG